jgi:hypothetical protein
MIRVVIPVEIKLTTGNTSSFASPARASTHAIFAFVSLTVKC